MIATLCLALLWARVGGVHLHLCFDGQEPARSLHISDQNHHGDHHALHHDAHHADHDDGHHAADAMHNDVDVSLLNEGLSKPVKLLVDLPLLLLAVLCIAALVRATMHTRGRGDPPPPLTSILSLRPPLRGPPVRAS